MALGGSSGLFQGSASRHILGFCVVSLVIWTVVFVLASPLKETLSQPATPGREFADFIEGAFLVMFGAYVIGGFGASTRMHIEGVWASENPGKDVFSRMTLGCVFGLLSYFALSEGLLQLLVSKDAIPDGKELKPTYVSILLFAMLSGMFANELFRSLKRRVPRDDNTDTPPSG
ncbi:MAG: hypothetical protein AAFY38_02435 [Pseudomonadota bacterium]